MDALATLQAIADNFSGFTKFVTLLAYVLGVFFVARGLYILAYGSKGNNPNASKPEGIATAVVGSLMVSFLTMMQVGSETIFGTTTGFRSAMDYSNVPTSGELAATVTVLVGFATLYGWFSCLRCFLILRDLSNQRSQYTFKDALIHGVAGITLANTLLTTDVIANSFGQENYVRVALGL